MEIQKMPAGLNPLFNPPFTREQLRLDLQNIILSEMRKLCHISSLDAVLPLLTPVDPFPFWDAGCSPDEIGITYDQVSKFTLAAACEDYFDYGVYAVAGKRTDSLQWDSIHTWIGAYLMDLSRSSYVDEWDTGEGHEGLRDAVNRCMFLCELANARAILEGGEYFFHFAGQDKDDDAGISGLSIRQLAMLSGMEEMSLRSYISRKTSPVLEVSKSDRKTFVGIEVAKQWLIAKGRYRPVEIARSSAEINLSKSSFDTFNAFTAMLRDRVAYMADKSDSRVTFEQAINTALNTSNIGDLNQLKPEAAADDTLMEQLAGLLDLPANHLKHRAKESALRTEILLCQHQLKQLQQEAIS